MHTLPATRALPIIFSLLALLLAGCATNVASTIKVSEENVAKYDSLTVEESVAAFEQRVNQAKQSGMPTLAPHYFGEAAKLLSDTQSLLAKKPRKAEVVSQIAKGDALLDKGQRIMVLVQKSFARELELKGLLDKFDAAKVYPKEYASVMDDLSDLIEKVELDKAEKIDKDQANLIAAMEALDIKTVQYSALHSSEEINKDSKDKDAEKQAPATFAEALRVYKDAQQRIAAAPHDEPAVKKAGDEAQFAALHARYVNERVAALQKQVKVSVEEVVLEEEQRLLAISNAIGYADLRDQPIAKQAETIATAAGKLALSKDEKEKADALLGGANDKIKDLEKQLKDANAAVAEGSGQIKAKDTEILNLNTRLTLLEKENKILGEQLSPTQPEPDTTAAPPVEPEAAPAAPEPAAAPAEAAAPTPEPAASAAPESAPAEAPAAAAPSEPAPAPAESDSPAATGTVEDVTPASTETAAPASAGGN